MKKNFALFALSMCVSGIALAVEPVGIVESADFLKAPAFTAQASVDNLLVQNNHGFWAAQEGAALSGHGFKTHRNALNIGYTHKVSPELTGGMSLSFGLSDHKNVIAKQQTTNTGLGLFAQYKPGTVFIKGAVAYGYAQNKMTLSSTPVAPLFGTRALPGDVLKDHQSTFGLGLKAGNDFAVSKQLTLTPSLVASYSNIGKHKLFNQLPDLKNATVLAGGVNGEAKWTVNDNLLLGADAGVSYVHMHNLNKQEEPIPPAQELLKDYGFTHDVHYKVGLSTKFNVNDAFSLNGGAGYERYNKSKFGGAYYRVNAMYNF